MKAAESKTTATFHSLQAKGVEQQPFFQVERTVGAFEGGSPAFFSAGSGNAAQPKPFFSKPFLQTKLTIGRPGDPYEQEADAMADVVVQQTSSRTQAPVLTHNWHQTGQVQPGLAQPRIQREAAMLFDPEQPQTEEGETVPSGVHLGTHRRSRAYMLDWDSRHRSFSPEAAPGTDRNSSMREIFEAHRQQQLEAIFGPETTLAQVQDQIRTAQAQGDVSEVSRLQSLLFRANQYAVVESLNVEGSSRYARAGGSTYCNIYSYDMVSALGGYLPRVWWTSRAIRRIRQGARVISREAYYAMSPRQRRADNVIAPIYNNTVHELNANALTSWMETWGGSFGWYQAADAEAAQTAANDGNIVIILAANRRASRSGHVNVVLAESPNQHEANRDAEGVVQAPLQSQAGSTNFKYQARQNAWWRDRNHERGGFWVFGGASRSPIATPEELGTGNPTIELESDAEPTVQPKPTT